MSEERPPLSAGMTGAELRRWYWLREELAAFARRLGIPASGPKELLTARLASHLDGATFGEPSPARPSARTQLTTPFAPDDRIPAGQRCSQALREWFTAQVGASFRFDGPMRAYLGGADGSQTLGDAVAWWYASRSDIPTTIDPQFEYNRFTRAWHAEHPEGASADLREAWRRYRSLPVDRRGRA